MLGPAASLTDPETMLLTGAADLGLTLGESICCRFRLFREELQHWNTRLNLTGLQSAADIVCKHFLDSLAIWPWIKDLVTLADLGTGAGFPGLPLKLVRPDLRLTLVEATGKKVAFLKYIVWRLGLEGVEIRQTYLTPAVGRQWGASFQGVVTRATWPLPRFLALAAPLLLPGGLVLSLKGPGCRRRNGRKPVKLRPPGGCQPRKTSVSGTWLQPFPSTNKLPATAAQPVRSRSRLMWWSQLTMPQIQESLAANRAVIIPFGAIEEHGPHLPLATDILHAEEVARRTAALYPCLIAPAVNYGVCRSTRDHPGTISISGATLRRLTQDLVREFYRQGSRRLVLLTGHAGSHQVAALTEAGEQLLEELPDLRLAVVNILSLLQEVLRTHPGLVKTPNDGHAGEIETAIMLAAFPNWCEGRRRQSGLLCPNSSSVGRNDASGPEGSGATPRPRPRSREKRSCSWKPKSWPPSFGNWQPRLIDPPTLKIGRQRRRMPKPPAPFIPPCLLFLRLDRFFFCGNIKIERGRLAQVDRALVSGTKGRVFESPIARQLNAKFVLPQQ